MYKKDQERDGLDALRSIATQAPYLELEQERDLARQIQAGSRAALDVLLRAHFRLVLGVAHEFSKGGCAKDELVSEGLLGLTIAAARFDPERGVRFATYASLWIRACMQRYQLANRSIVRPPSTRTARLLSAKLPRLAQAYLHEHGVPPDAEAIADALDLDAGEVRDIEVALQVRDVPCDGGSHELRSDAPNPEEQLATAESQCLERERVRRALTQLPARERIVVQLRHQGDKAATFTELGDTFGVSKERARQIDLSACRRLRELLAVA